MSINERHVGLKSGGNFSALKDYMDRRIVMRIPFVDSQDLSISAAQYSKIPSTVLSGVIGKGTTSNTSGAYIAAALAGAVGTAATTTISDTFGNILNLINLRDATTHEELQEIDGTNQRTIYGLIQCSSTVTDGDAIGGVGSENLQVSFVYYASNGTLTLATAFTRDIEFQANKLMIARNLPTIVMENGNLCPDIIERGVVPVKRYFVVTAPYIANEVITLSTGGGATAGTSTTSGDSVTLHTSAALMYSDNTCRVEYGGVDQRKGTGLDVVWDSATTFHFTFPLDVADWFLVERIL
jgi:hypothetical protein